MEGGERINHSLALFYNSHVGLGVEQQSDTPEGGARSFLETLVKTILFRHDIEQRYFRTIGYSDVSFVELRTIECIFAISGVALKMNSEIEHEDEFQLNRVRNCNVDTYQSHERMKRIAYPQRGGMKWRAVNSSVSCAIRCAARTLAGGAREVAQSCGKSYVDERKRLKDDKIDLPIFLRISGNTWRYCSRVLVRIFPRISDCNW